MALKEKKEAPQLTEPLTGEDAERLVDYMENPSPPPNQSTFLARAHEAFSKHFNSDSANSAF